MSDTLQERYDRTLAALTEARATFDDLEAQLQAHPYLRTSRWHWWQRAMLWPEYRDLEAEVDSARTKKLWLLVRSKSYLPAIRREQAVREARAKFDDLEPELQALWRVLDAWWGNG